MALRFIESFDHYSAQADRLLKWTGDINSAGEVHVGAGRFGGGNAWPNANNSREMYKTIDAQATWIVGFAFKTDGYATAPIFQFLDGTTPQCYLRLTSAGKLEAIRHSGVSLGVGTYTVPLNTWVYIEIKVTISDAAGVFVTKVDGVTDLNLSSVDTKNTANAYADAIALNGGALGTTGITCKFDDIYVCDGTGSAPSNDFLGDCRVEAIFPNGDGNSSQLVGSDGNSVNNSLLVDETTPNGDTDYVESSTVGDKDTYAFGNLSSTSGTVFGVQVLPYAKKTDAGTRAIKSVARLSGTEVDSADKTLSASYQYLSDVRETKPGGGAWTISDVNSAEFGVKVSA